MAVVSADFPISRPTAKTLTVLGMTIQPQTNSGFTSALIAPITRSYEKTFSTDSTKVQRYSWRKKTSPKLARSSSKNDLEIREHSVAFTSIRSQDGPPLVHSSKK